MNWLALADWLICFFPTGLEIHGGMDKAIMKNPRHHN